jgi:NAD-dependent SIR2 family protein deacetylase
MPIHDEPVNRAALAIAGADALLVAAGAGMGVDSGLPDFRGPEGFWNAYPAYREMGLDFRQLANPQWFEKDPALAWGFYGHRLNLYRATLPHAGFATLRRWALPMKGGAFVFTSNVDGHFQRSGFAEEQVMEVHGSILHAQCLEGCGAAGVTADQFEVSVDERTFRAQGELPRCPGCGALLRPNIMMFGDGGWDRTRTDRQELQLDAWLNHRSGNFVIVELGAGTAIPTVRHFSEGISHRQRATLIRINLREAHGPRETIGLAMGALAGLQAIDAARLSL